MIVYRWPEAVGVTRSEWSYVQGVAKSRSILTRRLYTSAFDRERRIASLTVSGHQNKGMGAGYMEALKRRLAGGAAAVRLYSWPVNWHLRGFITGSYTAVRGTSNVRVEVSGLPPDTFLGGPGDFVLLDDGAGGVMTRMMGNERVSTSGGTSSVQFIEQVPDGWSGTVTFGARDTGVFLPLSIPRAIQPARGDWSYDWTFEEVFAEEVDGGFEEQNPW